MQVTSIDYNDYVGRIGVGRVYRGSLGVKDALMHIRREGAQQPVRLKQLFTFEGWGAVSVSRYRAEISVPSWAFPTLILEIVSARKRCRKHCRQLK